MGKRKSEAPGQGRLLDLWSAPSDAGPAVGCFATSYTFDVEFFEQECLARFLSMRHGVTPEESDLAWILECEEKLSQVRVTALVDEAHCRGRRNPRWYLLPARSGPQAGIMHAKVSLLVWAKQMRLIVASANLTPSGYRQNREVYAGLDARKGEPLARKAWDDALDFLDDLAGLGGGKENPGVSAAKALVSEARKRLDELKGSPEIYGKSMFHGMGPGRPSLFDQLRKRWYLANGVVRDIYAVSPFFDPSDSGARKTVDALWRLGAEKGPVSLTISAPLERDKERGDVLLMPSSWKHTPRASCEVSFKGVEMVDAQVNERRALHGKAYFIENEDWQVSAVGSANLTAAGTGIGPRPNWEAMLSTLCRRSKDREEIAHIDAGWSAIAGEDVPSPVFQTRVEQDDDGELAGEPVPAGFEMAVYRRKNEAASIELHLGSGLPTGWELRQPFGERLIGEEEWNAAGRPRIWTWPWKEAGAPSGFDVRWPGAAGDAWLPVMAGSPEDLPAPEALRSLRLEDLVEILTSSRPLSVTAAMLAKRRAGAMAAGVVLDPLKRVDVSRFLIPKTRRISQALTAMRRRLEEPAASVEAMEWRLSGSVGVRALVEAIEREATGPEETAFFLSELCMELAATDPKGAEGHLSAAAQKRMISKATTSLIAEARKRLLAGGILADYARKALVLAEETP